MEKSSLNLLKSKRKSKAINIKNTKKIKKRERKKRFKHYLFLFLFILIIILLVFLCYIMIIRKKENEKENNIKIINEPILPESNKEYIVKEYNKSPINFDNIRYNFKNNIFNNRKIFKINYSYYPYTKIDKTKSYEENGQTIYDLTGMLNITKLDYFYNNIDINTLNLNHIHVMMGFDSNYVEISSIGIASILNTSSPDTYIHFHFLVLNVTFSDMKKIIGLKKINKNADFVFYNALQAVYDFGERAKNEPRGVGDYTRILAAEIVNNTNRILVMDSGDIIAQKDISEVFYFDLEDNYFAWTLEDVAGNDESWSKFFRHNFYPNSGICLFNIRLWRKDNLYKQSILAAHSYKKIPCPYQDILLVVSNYKFKYFPLKYNCIQFFNTDEDMKNRNKNSKAIQAWINSQRFSPYKYSIEEIIEAASDPVINHLYNNKIQNRVECNYLTLKWIKYAKLTGLYTDIKNKYPKPFNSCEKLLENNS